MLRINEANTDLPFKRLILFHGSGDSPEGFVKWIKSVSPKFFERCIAENWDVFIPRAPQKNYTLNGGYPQRVWFDRSGLDPKLPENIDDINEMCAEIVEETGISGFDGELIIGGLSMGAAMAYNFGLRYIQEKFPGKKVVKVFALSGFLQNDSRVFGLLNVENAPEIFIYHGAFDRLVPAAWGKQTFDKLKDVGFDKISFGMGKFDHTLDSEELNLLSKWLFKKD